MTTTTMNTTAPAAPAAHRQDDPYVVFLLKRLGRDLGYLMPLLPIAIASFTVAVTLFSVSLSTIVIWVGVPLGVGTLWAARGFANVERARLGALGLGRVAGTYRARPSADAPALRRWLADYKDPQMWRDLLHAVVDFPVAIAAWSIAFSWVVTGLGGVTSFIWGHWLPQDDVPEVWILEWLNSIPGMMITGALVLLSAPWVVHGLARLQLVIGRGLLGTNDDRALRAEVSRLTEAGKAAASAESTSLRRIERDLHDGPQQRLIRLQMDAQMAERKLDSDPEAARAALAEIRTQSAEALAELRALTRGFAPPLLTERGLAAALESLVERSTVPVSFTAELHQPLSTAAETAAYFTASEALANVAKHSQATTAVVTAVTDSGRLTLTVADNGKGGASADKGHGLRGLAERVEGAGGTLRVADGPDGGTIVIAEVPCD